MDFAPLSLGFQITVRRAADLQGALINKWHWGEINCTEKQNVFMQKERQYGADSGKYQEEKDSRTLWMKEVEGPDINRVVQIKSLKGEIRPWPQSLLYV